MTGVWKVLINYASGEAPSCHLSKFDSSKTNTLFALKKTGWGQSSKLYKIWNLPDRRTILPKFINDKEGKFAGPIQIFPVRARGPALILKSAGAHWVNGKQVEAQLDYGPGSEIGVGLKIGVTRSRKRSFKMAATELGYLLIKLSFGLSLWRDMSISWHGGKEL